MNWAYLYEGSYNLKNLSNYHRTANQLRPRTFLKKTKRRLSYSMKRTPIIEILQWTYPVGLQVDWVFPTMKNVDRKSKIKSSVVAGIVVHEEVFCQLPDFKWCLFIIPYYISNRNDSINIVTGNYIKIKSYLMMWWPTSRSCRVTQDENFNPWRDDNSRDISTPLSLFVCC